MVEKLSEDNWMPLEANPEVINEFIAKMGFETIFYRFYDILSFDEMGLAAIPQPVQAIVFLFDDTEVQEKHREEQEAKLKASGQYIDKDLFFMTQYAENACGTIAVFHSLVNLYNKTQSFVTKGSYLDRFIAETSKLSPDERGKYFEEDDNLKEEHKKAAKEGQSKQEEMPTAHFVCFIQFNGHLYELDGVKFAPINHGECSEDEFLSKAFKVIKEFTERDPDQIKFTALALAPDDGSMFD